MRDSIFTICTLLSYFSALSSNWGTEGVIFVLVVTIDNS